MKILHSADWHLDSPLNGDAFLRRALLQIPEQVVQVCKKENCDLMLLSGDLFDGKPTPDSLQALKKALEAVAIPVFIAPGNHDFVTPDSVWLTEKWSDNVHIFLKPAMESIGIPELDCRIYGAGFDAMDCPPLLPKFHAEGEESYHIAVLHGDPTQKNSPYNPITQAQIGTSGLHYLALGHIHKSGSLRSKGTLCAWPGCPMGRGFDELDEKGVLIVTLNDTAEARFLPLDTPRFYDLSAEILTDTHTAVASLLPAAENNDYYRIRLTGEAESVDLAFLKTAFARFPHLEFRDETVPVTDLWACMGQDSLEGVFFQQLHDALEQAPEEEKEAILLAAKLSRKLLDGREVQL